MPDDQALALIKPLTPAIVFAPGGVNDILDKITREVRSTQTDISTKAGREAVASLAYKVARSKTALDDMGKQLVADWKARSAAVDAERRTIREKLDELKDEVRKPLTDWENAEKDRIEAHESAITSIVLLAEIREFDPSPELVGERLAALDQLPVRDWQEFAKRAEAATTETRQRLTSIHQTAVKRETERAELERLRAEQLARTQKERDDKIAAEAAERARIEAETKAKREAEEAAARAEAERRQIEQREAEAVARAEKAEADRKAAAAKAERDARESAEAAERNRLAAIEAERKRVADEAARIAAETTKRENNKKHLAAINNEVLTALVALGVTAEIGKAVIAAIAKGEVPHTRIVY